MTKTTLGLVVLIAVAVAVIFAVHMAESNSRSPPPPATIMGIPRIASTSTVKHLPQSVQPATPTSVLADSPSVRDLTKQANAGDAHAACLVAYQLLRCSGGALKLARIMSDSDHGTGQTLTRKERDSIQRQQAAASDYVSSCRNAPSDAWQQGVRYLRQAALAGQPDAMYRYAEGEAMLDFAYIRSPEFDQWRNEAAGFMQLAFEAGYSPAILHLALAYGDDSTPFTGLVPDDPLKERAAWLLYGRLTGHRTTSPAKDPTIEQAANVMAAQWQRQYFNNLKPPIKIPVVISPGVEVYLDRDQQSGITTAEPCTK
jgi:TPR repeat protein